MKGKQTESSRAGHHRGFISTLLIRSSQNPIIGMCIIPFLGVAKIIYPRWQLWREIPGEVCDSLRLFIQGIIYSSITFIAVVLHFGLGSGLNYLSLPLWLRYPILVILAVTLWRINISLVRQYESRQITELNDRKTEIAPGVQPWMMTQGLGVVPHWVSFIGLLAVSAALALVISLAIIVARAVGSW